VPESMDAPGDGRLKARAMSDFNSWELNPQPLELEEGEIHVWRVYLDCGETALRQFEATLAADEKARANRFFSERDRNGFIATRGALRELLGRYVKRSAVHLEFDYGPRGKPSLRRECSQQSVQFSVSHSHGLALLAFAVGRHLGVDVELVRPNFAGEEIAERYFSRQEVMELQALPASLRDEGFFLCWTRKEAYVKASGEGLQVPLKSFRVSLTPGEPERLQSADSFHWSLRSLQPDPQYVGALVGEGRDWRLRCCDWRQVP